jgi:hypothetical protein
MEKKVTLQQFNLKEFLMSSVKNREELMNPNVFSMESPQKYQDDELRYQDVDSLYSDLIDENKYLFVNFSSNAMDNELTCIDGETYLYIREEDVEDHFEDEKFPEDFQPAVNLKIYEDSSVGYLMKYQEEKLHIQSAVIEATSSTITAQDNVEMLNKPMEKYLWRFMK